MRALSSLRRKIIWGILLWVVVAAVITMMADFRQVAAALRGFKLPLLPALLGLTSMNYLLRFVKWQFFLQRVNINVPAGESLRIFLSGLAMSVTPGKVGEIIKSLLLKEVKGFPMSRTVPVLFVDRLSDGFGMIILSLSGIAMFRYGREILLLAGTGMFLLVLVTKTPRFYRPLIALCSRISLFARFAGRLETMILSAGQLLTVRTFGIAVALTVVSWFFECLAFYYVFQGMGYEIPIWAATFILSFSSIVGAVSMLPGGLGAVEGSIMGLLVKLMGVPMGTAAVAAILIRFSTLWFGVALGLLALFSYRKLLSPLDEIAKPRR